MRSLFVVLVVACVQPARTIEIESPTPPRPSLPAPVVGWLDAVAREGLDCPMSLLEAREVRVAARGAGELDHVVHNVTCLCDVVDKGYRLEHACGITPQVSRLEPRLPEDGPWSPDEVRLQAWERALVAKIRAGTTPDRLARRVPLADELAAVRRRLAEDGDPDSESLRQLKDAVQRVRSDARSPCLLEQDLEAVKLHLANHERVDLRGLQSAPGRALLAEAEALVRPMRAKMNVCKQLKNDREYQALWVELEGAHRQHNIERDHSRLTGNQASCNSDTDGSPECMAERRIGRIEKRIEAIERRYGLAE